MRALCVFALILAAMAIIDLHYSNRLIADLATNASYSGTSQMFAHLFSQAVEEQPVDDHLIENALNSRYMQWGAVGVMLMLFTWIITRHLPAQDQRRDQVIKEVVERSDELARETRDTFLESLRERDNQYLSCLKEIRQSSERQSDRAFEQKDKLAEAFNNIASAMRHEKQ